MQRKFSRYILFFTFFLFLTPNLSYSQETKLNSLDVKFDINPDYSVRQSMNYHFSEPFYKENVEYHLTEKVSNIESSDDNGKLQTQLLQNKDEYVLRITLKEPTKTIKLVYDTDYLIYKSEKINFFSTEFNFENNVELLTTELLLPIGHGIYKNLFNPEFGEIVSDGNRIFLKWTQNNISIASYSVKFVQIRRQANFWPIISFFLVAFIFVFYIYHRKKTKIDFLIGFRQDEQKVIMFLQKNKSVFQNRIRQEFNFPRAKVTRIMAKLEEKKLIRKEEYGRTNKIHWLK